MTSTQETEAFGRTVGTTGSTGSPFGYHGADGYRSDGDGPAGLEPYQKVGARYYDATFGRFITRDTDLSQSPYAYCGGDPVNCTDPSGHDTIPVQTPSVPDGSVGTAPPPGQSPDEGYGEPGGPDGSGGTTYPADGGLSGPQPVNNVTADPGGSLGVDAGRTNVSAGNLNGPGAPNVTASVSANAGAVSVSAGVTGAQGAGAAYNAGIQYNSGNFYLGYGSGGMFTFGYKFPK